MGNDGEVIVKCKTGVWKVSSEIGLKQLMVCSHGISGQGLRKASQASTGQLGPSLFSMVSQDPREATGWEVAGVTDTRNIIKSHPFIK